MCDDYSKYYYQYLKQRDGLPSQAADHIGSCAQCQQELVRLKEAMENAAANKDERKLLLRKHLTLHVSMMNQWVRCEQARPFIPAMLLDFMHISQSTPVTAHLEKCSQCKEHYKQMKQMGLSSEELIAASQFLAGKKELTFSSEVTRLLKNIDNTPESGIITRMRSMEDSVDNAHSNPAKGLSTEVCCRPHMNVYRRSRSLSYLLSGSLAAAAVLLLVTMLPTAASGLNLKTLSSSVKAISNIHIERYSEDGSLIQEIWVSRPLGFKLYKQSEKVFYKDVHTGRVIQGTPENEFSYRNDGLREEEGYARILPFEQLKDLPPEYEWTYKGDSILANNESAQIYELTWDHINAGMIIHKKWRVYIGAETKLPHQIEWLERTPEAQDYHLITTSKVGYPSEAECQQQLEKHGFQRLLNLDHAE